MSPKNKKTISAFARDKKYLQFLMDVFLKTCKGYTPITLTTLVTQHKVDKATPTALQEIGWLGKTGSLRATNYFWRGPNPTDEMAEEIQIKISKLKSVQKFNLANKQVPISKTGKALIPVIKSTEHVHRKVLSGATGRYLKIMEDLYLEANDAPKRISLVTLSRENKIGTTVPKVLLAMNLLKKTIGKNEYQWVGPLPTLELAEQVLVNVNSGIKSFLKPTPPKTDKPIVYEEVKNIQEAMRSTAKHVRIVKTQSQNDLKKSIALKLLKLGELEQADKLLGEIIN